MRISAAAEPGIPKTSEIVVLVVVVSLAVLNLDLIRPLTAAAVARCVFSVAALAAIFLARRRSLFKRALFALTLETLGGGLAFVLVDLPFIQQHRAEIGNAATAFYCRLKPRGARPAASGVLNSKTFVAAPAGSGGGTTAP